MKLKKLSIWAITAIMGLSSITYSVYAKETKVNELPTKEQFATVDELKTFNTNDNDGEVNPAKVYFGNNNQQWWITGSQNNDSMTLFAASPLATGQVFDSSTSDKEYKTEWNCTYSNVAPTDVYVNHYGASTLRTKLKDLENSYFTSNEQALMNDTTIYTSDTKNNSVYSTTDKLYLAYGDYDDGQYITVGTNSLDNLNNGFRIDKNYWGGDDFWLRGPCPNNIGVSNYTLMGSANYGYVYLTTVIYSGTVVPAFELNSSSVLFASAALAASSDGDLTLQDTDGNGAFTLRYDANKYSKNLGSVLFSYDKSNVILKDVPTDTYLVLQNKDGAYAKAVSGTSSISASDMGLDNFDNCKVWLEKTDNTDRMTYATLATDQQLYTVNVSLLDGMKVSSGNLTQQVYQNNSIENILISAEDGYYFPDDYSVSEQNGITVKRDGENLLVISGTPTADVTLTLPSATKWIESVIGYSQFATKEELRTLFDTNDSTNYKQGQKVYFGKDNQQWWIVGSQQEQGLTLFAASPLLEEQQFEPIKDKNKTYLESWNCDYSITGFSNPNEVYSNHYGGSKIRRNLQELERSFFSDIEQTLMNETTILTEDEKNKSTYATTDKLYLPVGYFRESYITAGINNGLRIDNTYWINDRAWLRTPEIDGSIWGSSQGVTWHEGPFVTTSTVDIEEDVVPVFELNLSSVLFGSTVSAVASSGKQNINDAFTLRYQPQSSIGTAKLSGTKESVAITDITNENTYLVVQSKDGAWSKKVSSNDLIFADEMSDTLTSFEDCKVWLETTDSDQRMTYATMATETTEITEKNFKLTVGNNMTVANGNAVQIDVNGAISDIIVKAEEGYIFPVDYTVAEQNGITVTRDNENQLTISGTPTSDVNLTLPPATQKAYGMILNGNGTFTNTCEGYNPITENEFTITNNGNVDLENVNVSMKGTDYDKFDLTWDKAVTTIQPNGTITVKVKPKDDLKAGAYQATLSVSADHTTEQTIDLQFTVSEHDYNKVVTAPTCTEKGYTTYTCKNCTHSYVGDEVAVKGHTFGDWEIINSPTCEQAGSRKHICKECGFQELENLDPNGHEWETDYTVDKAPTCIQDGSKSIHCKNCDAVKDSVVISKLGHSFTKYVSDDNATCTENATETAKCERCDETDTRTVENSAFGHKWGEWKVIKEATTTTTGEKERICERCGDKETEVIAILPNEDTNKPNNEKDKDSVDTGDQTNTGLYTSMFTISALGIAVLAVLKKKKVLEHK